MSHNVEALRGDDLAALRKRVEDLEAQVAELRRGRIQLTIGVGHLAVATRRLLSYVNETFLADEGSDDEEPKIIVDKIAEALRTVQSLGPSHDVPE